MASQYVSVLQHLNDSLDTLSPQQQRAAHYVLNHPQEVGLQSMRAVATAARVTPATISRMCRTLGFKNYQSFKAPFVQSLRNTGPGYVSQFKNVQKRGAEHASDLYAELRTQDIANVEHSISDANFPVLFDAAETIRTSRRVYVLGLRGCYSAAFYFHYAYQLFRDNSRLVESHAGMFADQFRGMSSDDCMLVISFDPYTKMTIDAIEYAASAKVK